MNTFKNTGTRDAHNSSPALEPVSLTDVIVRKFSFNENEKYAKCTAEIFTFTFVARVGVTTPSPRQTTNTNNLANVFFS